MGFPIAYSNVRLSWLGLVRRHARRVDVQRHTHAPTHKGDPLLAMKHPT